MSLIINYFTILVDLTLSEYNFREKEHDPIS